MWNPVIEMRIRSVHVAWQIILKPVAWRIALTWNELVVNQGFRVHAPIAAIARYQTDLPQYANEEDDKEPSPPKLIHHVLLADFNWPYVLF
jgi:hypothetical protein